MNNTARKLAAGLAAVLLCAAMGGAAASAAEEATVSPALAILSRDLSMVKSGVGREVIAFEASDFEEALGVSELNSVVIRTLPMASDGKLMLGSLEVMRNQTISRANLSALRFVPTGTGRDAAFVFEAGGEASYSVTCTLRILEKSNYAPTSAGVDEDRFTLRTFKNIAVYGTLPASDPEGDGLTFEVVSYPKKGLLALTDRDDGQFVYTPVKNYAGKDSFTYTVTDEYGNRSDEMTVTIRISSSEHGTVFEDMIGHWGHYSAIRLSDLGIMTGKVEGEKNLFGPDEPVSRAAFLAMTMKAAGIRVTQDEEDVVTVFHDDREIPQAYRAYVAVAYEKGYIRGFEENGLPVFDPNGNVTRAEACVMIGNILSAKAPVVKPVFADDSDIPAWAVDSIYALTSLGILSGTGNGYVSPHEEIDRAQVAELLAAVADLKG